MCDDCKRKEIEQHNVREYRDEKCEDIFFFIKKIPLIFLYINFLVNIRKVVVCQLITYYERARSKKFSKFTDYLRIGYRSCVRSYCRKSYERLHRGQIYVIKTVCLGVSKKTFKCKKLIASILYIP